MSAKKKSRNGDGLVSMTRHGSPSAVVSAHMNLTTKPERAVSYAVRSMVREFFDDPENVSRFEAWLAERGRS